MQNQIGGAGGAEQTKSLLGMIAKQSGQMTADMEIRAPRQHGQGLVGRITAGVPILAVEQIEEYLPVSGELGDREDLFALRVVGLSMKNAGILDGDIVIADKSKVAEVGDIVIALIDDEATVKRLGKEQGKPVLYPENEDFSTIYPENLKILGKVVATFRRY